MPGADCRGRPAGAHPEPARNRNPRRAAAGKLPGQPRNELLRLGHRPLGRPRTRAESRRFLQLLLLRGGDGGRPGPGGFRLANHHPEANPHRGGTVRRLLRRRGARAAHRGGIPGGPRGARRIRRIHRPLGRRPQDNGDELHLPDPPLRDAAAVPPAGLGLRLPDRLRPAAGGGGAPQPA